MWAISSGFVPMRNRSAGLAGAVHLFRREEMGICRANLARPGREQPKSGRWALVDSGEEEAGREAVSQ